MSEGTPDYLSTESQERQHEVDVPVERKWDDLAELERRLRRVELELELIKAMLGNPVLPPMGSAQGEASPGKLGYL